MQDVSNNIIFKELFQCHYSESRSSDYSTAQEFFCGFLMGVPAAMLTHPMVYQFA